MHATKEQHGVLQEHIPAVSVGPDGAQVVWESGRTARRREEPKGGCDPGWDLLERALESWET